MSDFLSILDLNYPTLKLGLIDFYCFILISLLTEAYPNLLSIFESSRKQLMTMPQLLCFYQHLIAYSERSIRVDQKKMKFDKILYIYKIYLESDFFKSTSSPKIFQRYFANQDILGISHS